MFWTIPIPPDSVQVDLDNATASLQLTNLSIRDDHDVANAITGNQGFPPLNIPAVAPVPATVSFDVEWSGMLSRKKIVNETLDFTGQFIKTIASISWSASQAGFEFVSEPPNPSRNVYSVIGKERNGVFFQQGS